MAIYVGFDSSTQGLTAVAIDVSDAGREVVFTRTLGFDTEWPAYGTLHGVVPGGDPLVALAPPLVWVEALERMMGELATSIDLTRVRAIGGSAQQHGSVYLRHGAGDLLGRLDAGRALVDQIAPCLAREGAPIWRDASTSRECREISEALGGPGTVARLTGSRPFERFTGPQIRKFATREPAAYAETERVHLVSSFLCSLLTGTHAPVDHGDASGMNLMDIALRAWSPAALDATAAALHEKLPAIVPSATVFGTLAPFWGHRHGWPTVSVAAWERSWRRFHAMPRARKAPRVA